MKLLIVQDCIPHYRIKFFDNLSRNYDVTITTTGNETSNNFKVFKIDLKSLFGFFWISSKTSLNLNEFDVVIFTFNIRWLTLIKTLLVRNKNIKIILWGIGVSTESGFDTKTNFDFIRFWCSKKADAIVFYSEYPIQKYVEVGGILRDKIFIAHNSLDIKPSFYKKEREYFLFVGTLKKYKKIEELVLLYSRAFDLKEDLQNLYIIGDGEYFNSLKLLINKLKLENKIFLLGEVVDIKILTTVYSKAIACLSPYQSGLTVLQSMALGVPFVTMSNSITGGERLNIKHMENGILTVDDDDFVHTLLKLSQNQSLSNQMGESAYFYFLNNRTIEDMLNGMKKAIKYVKF